jgi:hypothetical protein
MSEYIVCEAELNDMAIIKESLSELGIDCDQIQIHDNPVKLSGWNKVQQAHVIIPAKIAGTRSDIGLEKTSSGYKLWVYDTDLHRGLGVQIHSGKLKQCYAKNMVLREIRKQVGRSKISVQEDENDRIRIRVRL